jgi:hypothetical protein
MDLAKAVTVGLFAARQGAADPDDECRKQEQGSGRSPAGRWPEDQGDGSSELGDWQQDAARAGQPRWHTEVGKRPPRALKIEQFADPGRHEDSRQRHPKPQDNRCHLFTM